VNPSMLSDSQILEEEIDENYEPTVEGKEKLKKKKILLF
jgi:hypothetical protein